MNDLDTNAVKFSLSTMTNSFQFKMIAFNKYQSMKNILYVKGTEKRELWSKERGNEMCM